MLGFLATAVVALSGLDHWTTYLCLRAPINGFEVTEANPLAEWIFEGLGLVPGLMLDGFVTLGAVAFLLGTPLLPRRVKIAALMVIVLFTTAAVANNLDALAALELSPLGVAL